MFIEESGAGEGTKSDWKEAEKEAQAWKCDGVFHWIANRSFVLIACR